MNKSRLRKKRKLFLRSSQITRIKWREKRYLRRVLFSKPPVFWQKVGSDFRYGHWVGFLEEGD